MRYIVLRTLLKPEGAVCIEGLTSIEQRASGITSRWINLEEAKTNYWQPEKCDLLSFEDRSDLEENIELWGFDDTVGILGVDTDAVSNFHAE